MYVCRHMIAYATIRKTCNVNTTDACVHSVSLFQVKILLNIQSIFLIFSVAALGIVA